jgi:hypothetical protein
VDKYEEVGLYHFVVLMNRLIESWSCITELNGKMTKEYLMVEVDMAMVGLEPAEGYGGESIVKSEVCRHDLIEINLLEASQKTI